MSVFLSFPD